MNLGSRYVSGGCGCGGSAPQRPTVSCDTRTIKSIHQSGDQVYVVYDDCTVVVAPISVVDKASFGKKTNHEPTAPTGDVNDDHEPLYSLGGQVVGEIKHAG